MPVPHLYSLIALRMQCLCLYKLAQINQSMHNYRKHNQNKLNKNLLHRCCRLTTIIKRICFYYHTPNMLVNYAPNPQIVVKIVH